MANRHLVSTRNTPKGPPPRSDFVVHPTEGRYDSELEKLWHRGVRDLRFDIEWPPGTVVEVCAIGPSLPNGGHEKGLAIVCEYKPVTEEDDSSGGGPILVFDGRTHHRLYPEDLCRLDLDKEMALRRLSHASATVSPHCFASNTDMHGKWDWLTAGGQGVDIVEVPVPRHSVPHIIGKRGQSITKMEDFFGIVVGIRDGDEAEEAFVSLIGPKTCLEAASFVLNCVARGARSILTRLGPQHCST